MFQILSNHHPKQRLYERVSSILRRIYFHPQNTHFCTAALTKTPSSSSEENRALKELKPIGIAKSVISKCSRHWDTDKGEIFITPSLKDYFLRLSDTSPEIVRRYWRVSELKPQDVLEILLGFESKTGKCEVEIKKTVESLWGIFEWASGQNREFVQFPQSCKIMASMLVRDGRFQEAEHLLSRKENQGILPGCEEIFGNLIEGYLGNFELDKGLLVYEGMRRLGLVPSFSTYNAILEYLVELSETELTYIVYMDMMKMGVGMSLEEKEIHDNVIRLLCLDGKVQEARNLVKRISCFGIKPSNLVVNAICSVYSAKNDYNDLLSFFSEANIEPGVKLGNKILFSLGGNFGLDQASAFLQKLEGLNFCPDAITFGILIGFSCREGKLKSTFFYISDILSRGLIPHVYTYNAILSGMFKESLGMHAQDLLVEMKDTGVTPNLSTYRVLLAGFCKTRQFDRVKEIVSEMSTLDLITLSPFEDLLTKAFTVLGLSPLDVKIKRDNDKGLYKTEFFDSLGNGLYLETDMDEYEKRITKVLEDAMVLDFNSTIIERFHSLDVNSSRIMVDEMSKWGQELSLHAFSCLLNLLSKDPFTVGEVNHHLSVMPESIYRLDHKSLNILVWIYSNKGAPSRARMLFDGILRRGFTIENSTYSALLFDVCKKGDLRSFHYLRELARKSNWSPDAKDGNALLDYLCKNKWFREAFELFEIMLYVSPNNITHTLQSLLENLCSQGFTSTARVFIEEFSFKDAISDRTAYSLLVTGFFREQKFTEALKVFEMMLFKNLSPPLDISTRMISRLCKSNFEKAVELKNVILTGQPCALIPVNSALIKGYCKSGRIQEAVSLFKEILLLKGFSILDSEVYNDFIEFYCGQNNFGKVKELVGLMVRGNLTISVSNYSKMVHAFCAEGTFSTALSLKALMLQVSNLSEMILYNILIFHVSSMRNGILLDKIISALKRKGFHFDSVTYNYVIHGLLLCGDTTRSLHYLTAMIDRDLKPSGRSLLKVISSLCENSDINRSLDLSREMELKGWGLGSYIQNKIVGAFLDENNIREAIVFLEKLASKDFLIPNRVNYDYLIKRFCELGRLDKSTELLDIMLRKGSNPESTSYDYIIRGLCDRYSQWDKALDYYTEMRCRDLKPSLVTSETLVCGLSRCGRLLEAEKILRSTVEMGENPRREVFESLVDGYRLGKNNGKVCELLKFMQEKGYEPDFNTHWSLISNLSDSSKNDERCGSVGFLSGLLSGFGVARKKT